MERFAARRFPIGVLRVGYENGAVTSLKRVETAERGEENALTEQVFVQLEEYFAGQRWTFVFPFELRGTPFQKKVWAALRDIPYGETRSYKQVAEAVGQEKACRAGGMANNRNPVIIAVPCHRVIGADGGLVGYGGGLDMKQALRELEKRKR